MKTLRRRLRDELVSRGYDEHPDSPALFNELLDDLEEAVKVWMLDFATPIIQDDYSEQDVED